MRILRLDLGSGRSIDVHPFVTVLSELDDVDRTDLLESIRTLARGSTAEIRGLVQNQGLLLELDGSGHDRLASLTAADVVIDGGRERSGDRGWLRAEVDQQHRRAEIAAVVVEEIRADIDPSARARVAAIEERLAPADDEQALRRRARIERVAAALDAVDRIERVLVESPPGVRQLQAELEQNSNRLADAKRHFKQLARDIERAQVTVDEASASLKAARIAAKPVLLTREEEARLELLSFPAADQTRKGKWRKTLRPEEASEMEALLCKVGVESYTAYTVYRASPTASKQRVDAALAAEATLDEAENRLRSAQQAKESDRLRRELTSETEALREQARGYLGMMLPGDVAQGLSALTVRVDNPEWEAAATRLGALLDELDIEWGEQSVGHRPAVDSGRHHPAGACPAGDRVAGEPAAGGTTSTRESAEAAVEGARSWLRFHDADEGQTSTDDLRRKLDRERGALDRHQRALARIGRAEAAAVESALGLARLQEQLAASGPDEADPVEGLLSLVEPIAVQVGLEGRGSVPVALVGDLDGVSDADVAPLMARLSEISESLQVLVVTDRSAVLDWVGAVGLNAAMVSRARPAARAGRR